ncbi:PTS sugar transporter subunit IIA [Klebsiella quasipneumoniae]|uniref:PTS sugar transporter subunit IIA n=1 Tax=Klebsiella quasipneumoniae TaxID=1463165 RepID=UPI000CEC1966|nr:PTS sugar transporter subunit IIA [Klebsiella quasipneumoniae]ROC60475.1 PTS sugar transporter subunit IIA [Klebsiella quasipneumoniae subsp. quasipneumoniae]
MEVENKPKILFSESLVFLDSLAADQDTYFDGTVAILLEKGLVRETFLEKIKQREKNYPTGLPTESVAIALPHTDIEHVVDPFIAVTRVVKPVHWIEMGSDDSPVEVQFIFMLGLKDKNSHVELLQNLIEAFSDSEFVSAMLNTTSATETVSILNSKVQI